MTYSNLIPTIQKKQVIETGLLVVAICLLVGLYRDQSIWYRAALVVTGLTLLIPWLFYPLAVGWFGLGNALSRITSTVLLVVLFVGLVIPMAWIRKAMGKDALRTKSFKKGNDSVFIDRLHTFLASDLQYPF